MYVCDTTGFWQARSQLPQLSCHQGVGAKRRLPISDVRGETVQGGIFEPKRYGAAVASEAQREPMTGGTAYRSIFETKRYGGDITAAHPPIDL